VNPEQNPQDYDEVTRLRLRINHLELQRDAFAAVLRKEVREFISEVIRNEIRRQLGGDENARLKAEVERLTDAITRGAITPDAKEEQK
jgi:histidyl-tRNA synthetase